jgi:hypothetical protein
MDCGPPAVNTDMAEGAISILWPPTRQGGFELAGQLSTTMTVTELLLAVF